MGSNVARCVILLGILTIFLIEEIPGKHDFDHKCKKNEDCLKKFICDKATKTCRCSNYGAILVQYYDSRHKKCVSAVEKACTRVKDDSVPWECVENTDCLPHRRSDISQEVFGMCKCAGRYEETENHTCLFPEDRASAEKMEDDKTNYKIDENVSKNWHQWGNSAAKLQSSYCTALLLIFCIITLWGFHTFMDDSQ